MTSNEKTIDLRVPAADLRSDHVECTTCHTAIPLFEIFDGWDAGLDRETCPRCEGALLSPLVPA